MVSFLGNIEAKPDLSDAIQNILEKIQEDLAAIRKDLDAMKEASNGK